MPFSSVQHPIDIALVELTTEGVRISEQSKDALQFIDFITSDALRDIEVTAFLSTAHDYSRTTRSLDGPLDLEIESPPRGKYFLQQVVVTRAVVSNPGDSGTIVFNGTKSSASAAGLCVGQFGSMTVIEPLARALSTLRNETSLPLDIL